MKWKLKNKCEVRNNTYRIRKKFAFLPILSRSNHWHWFENVGVVEYCIRVSTEYTWFGKHCEGEWREQFIIDASLISAAQKCIYSAPSPSNAYSRLLDLIDTPGEAK